LDNHFLDSNLQVLRRFGAQCDQPLPANWGSFVAKNPDLAIQIEMADPELVAVLSNQVGASTKADILAGKWSAVAPSQEQQQQQAKQKRVEELIASNPYVDGRMVNMGAAFELDELAPEMGAKLRKAAGYMHPHERDAKAAADREAQAKWMDQVTAQGRLRQLQNQAQGVY
jgi:hypothetical protein